MIKLRNVLGLLTFASILSACGATTGPNTPSLGGNRPYTSTVPPPSDYQANSAIDASTMRRPIPE